MSNINIDQLKAKQDNGDDFLLLDVREQHEYDEANMGGILIPLGDLTARAEELSEYRNKTIVVHCRSGQRSLMGQHILLSSGYTDVYNLEGGILAWQEKHT